MERPPRAIRWQFLAASLVSAGLLVSILVWDRVHVTRELFYNQAGEAARLNARVLQVLAVEALESGDLKSLRRRLRKLASSPEIVYIDLLDNKLKPIVSFTNTEVKGKALPDTREAAQEYLYEIQLPLYSGSRSLGRLRVGTNVKGLKDAVDAQMWRGLFLALILLSGVAAIAWWFGSIIGSRVRRLTEEIRRLPAGGGVIAVGGSDEVAFLARTFNDMSRRLEAERRERRKLEKFKEDLTHMLVHDLKNPLTTLSLLSWSLANDGKTARVDRKQLGLLERNVHQLEEMVRGILDVAKMQSMKSAMKRELVAPLKLVEDCIQDYHLQAESKSLFLSGDAAEDLPQVHGDPEILRRVLGNLVSNALHHTPEGGGVKVSAAARGSDVVFAVSDNGQGIPAADRERIFEKFTQGSRPSAKGSGLGLAFCRMAAEMHGGKIWVESEEGRGSTFFFTLPASASGPPALEPPAPPASSPEDSSEPESSSVA